jgi:2-desacetyl-2-hydroxyethyl bacteriochlorophyllide A dehydrogenase
MLAARYYGIRDVRIEELPRPGCGPKEVLVKVAYAGICGSDLHIYRKGMFVSSVPETMGHEFSGVVEEIGPGVTGLRPGDHVVGDPRVSCGDCPWCRQGKHNLCPQLSFIGEICPGCFAEYLVMSEESLLKLPLELELDRAALIEPLAVALHAAGKAGLSPRETLGIIGAGPVGLLTLLVAKHQVAKIIVVDRAPARLELARRLGADEVVPVFSEDPLEQADVVIEAAGTEATLGGALRWLKPGGRLVLTGLYEEGVLVDPNDILVKELKIDGINAYERKDLTKAVQVMATGRLDVAPLISQILPLESAAAGFGMLTSPQPDVVKILLAPTGPGKGT